MGRSESGPRCGFRCRPEEPAESVQTMENPDFTTEGRSHKQEGLDPRVELLRMCRSCEPLFGAGGDYHLAPSRRRSTIAATWGCCASAIAHIDNRLSLHLRAILNHLAGGMPIGARPFGLEGRADVSWRFSSAVVIQLPDCIAPAHDELKELPFFQLSARREARALRADRSKWANSSGRKRLSPQRERNGREGWEDYAPQGSRSRSRRMFAIRGESWSDITDSRGRLSRSESRTCPARSSRVRTCGSGLTAHAVFIGCEGWPWTLGAIWSFSSGNPLNRPLNNV